MREESVVADVHETGGKLVQEEASQELGALDLERARLVLVSAIFPAKVDIAFLDGEDPRVVDGNAMGVSGEILENLLGSSKGWLRVDHPVPSSLLIEPARPLVRILEGRTGKVEPARAIVMVEVGEELSPKERRENAHGQEEPLAPTRDPAIVIRTEAPPATTQWTWG